MSIIEKNIACYVNLKLSLKNCIKDIIYSAYIFYSQKLDHRLTSSVSILHIFTYKIPKYKLCNWENFSVKEGETSFYNV